MKGVEPYESDAILDHGKLDEMIGIGGRRERIAGMTQSPAHGITAIVIARNREIGKVQLVKPLIKMMVASFLAMVGKITGQHTIVGVLMKGLDVIKGRIQRGIGIVSTDTTTLFNQMEIGEPNQFQGWM